MEVFPCPPTDCRPMEDFPPMDCRPAPTDCLPALLFFFLPPLTRGIIECLDFPFRLPFGSSALERDDEPPPTPNEVFLDNG